MFGYSLINHYGFCRCNWRLLFIQHLHSKFVKGLVLLSAGIDSPVAAYVSKEHVDELGLVHFDNRPFTDDKEFSKIEKLRKQLQAHYENPIASYVVPFGPTVQVALAKLKDRHQHCVLCRRFMLKLASTLASKEGYDALITGESLGQVASQTLKNLMVEETASSVPIIRPLIGLDKTEIIDIAKEIGTFDISTSSGLCCTITPNKPSTGADMEKILSLEGQLDEKQIIEVSLKGLEKE